MNKNKKILLVGKEPDLTLTFKVALEEVSFIIMLVAPYMPPRVSMSLDI